jgi:hypothetical protein
MRTPKLQNCPVDDCGRQPDVLNQNGTISISCPKGHIIVQSKTMKDAASQWNERRFNQKVP